MISQLNDEELTIFMWQTNRTGHFKTTLFSAICKADEENLARLERGFPVEVKGYRLYSMEPGWWENVQKVVKEGTTDGRDKDTASTRG